MPELLLVKHSLPEIRPDVPACDWRLSAAGRARCRPLARLLAPYRLAAVVTSTEPKAIETGEEVARALDLPLHTAPDLHEHDRSNVPFLGQAAFEAAVAQFFAQPQRLVLGCETADQAHERFDRAIRSVLDRHPQQTLAVVTHGTVISLFTARLTGADPFALWQQLDLPSLVVLERPELRLQRIVERVGTDKGRAA